MGKSLAINDVSNVITAKIEGGADIDATSVVRVKATDDATIVTPPREMGLDAALEWIADDELVEVTPTSVRMRKRIMQKSFRK